MRISVARANTPAKPSSCASAVSTLDAETSTATISSGPSAPEQGGRAHALERHVGMRDGEHLFALEAERDLAQLGDAHTAGPGGTDERADARPDDTGRPVAALEQRLEHAHVGEPLHPAAAQNEGERCVAFHSPIRLPGGLSPE